jgi:hypothetical protein
VVLVQAEGRAAEAVAIALKAEDVGVVGVEWSDLEA